MSTGQYKFKWDANTGDVDTDNVVASKANERGPKEKQADLLDHERDTEQLKTWVDQSNN